MIDWPTSMTGCKACYQLLSFCLLPCSHMTAMTVAPPQWHGITPRCIVSWHGQFALSRSSICLCVPSALCYMITRAVASHSPRQQSHRQWGLAQMVRALFLHAHGHPVAEAARLASTETASVSTSSLQRHYTAMMQQLPNAVTADEVDITAWIQEYESSMTDTALTFCTN